MFTLLKGSDRYKRNSDPENTVDIICSFYSVHPFSALLQYSFSLAIQKGSKVLIKNTSNFYRAIIYLLYLQIYKLPLTVERKQGINW